jgi:hypothetical protein
MSNPKKSKGDAAHVAVKSLLSAVPAIGGPLAELFAYLIAEPISKRRDAWMEEIADQLLKLQAREATPLFERLKDEPSFTTVLVNASQMAVRTHQKEKIRALRNAVLNAALGILPDDTERAIVLGLVDQLTPAHVAILSVMQNPRANQQVSQRLANVSMGGLPLVVFAALPQLSGRKELVEVLWRELVDAGLLTSVNLNVTMTGSGLLEKRTTAFGDRFLGFIADPPE